MSKLFIILALFWIFTTTALAQATMYNDEYKIRMGNLNSVAGKSTGTSAKLNITVGQTGPGLYSGTNYKIRAGFQYISSIIPFRFTISQIAVDLGTLTPTNPVTRTNTLTVYNQSAYGYNVTSSENHQLLVPSSGAIIPDTRCDGGACNESLSGIWNSTLTYGFGYRCDGVGSSNHCASGFLGSSNYKQFADLSKSETAQPVMSGITGKNQQVQITYKANISADQAGGLYTNVITYIATPTY